MKNRCYQFPVLLLPPVESADPYDINNTETTYPEDHGIKAFADKQIDQGREFWGAKKLNSELSGLIWIPFPHNYMVKETWKIKDVMTERTFDLISPPIDTEEKRLELELHVKEVK